MLFTLFLLSAAKSPEKLESSDLSELRETIKDLKKQIAYLRQNLEYEQELQQNWIFGAIVPKPPAWISKWFNSPEYDYDDYEDYYYPKPQFRGYRPRSYRNARAALPQQQRPFWGAQQYQNKPTNGVRRPTPVSASTPKQPEAKAQNR